MTLSDKHFRCFVGLCLVGGQLAVDFFLLSTPDLIWGLIRHLSSTLRICNSSYSVYVCLDTGAGVLFISAVAVGWVHRWETQMCVWTQTCILFCGTWLNWDSFFGELLLCVYSLHSFHPWDKFFEGAPRCKLFPSISVCFGENHYCFHQLGMRAPLNWVLNTISNVTASI